VDKKDVGRKRKRAIEPRKRKWDRPMSSKRQKATSAILTREGKLTPRGLRARHAFKGNKVNVGDPGGSSKEVLADKRKSKEAEKKKEKKGQQGVRGIIVPARPVTTVEGRIPGNYQPQRRNVAWDNRTTQRRTQNSRG
jgi:hypothetical protein